MIRYGINRNLSLSIKIRRGVSKSEMEELAFNIEGMVDDNQKIPIRFQLEDGLPMHWIKYIERLCKNIPNTYSILREPSLA